jgi:hypothetical protein
MLKLPEPYVIDANIFIEAARTYYAFDIAKPFWDGLVNFAKAGKIVSVDKVYDEIMNGNDALKDWADSDFKRFFHKAETIPITEHYAEIVIWAASEPQYSQNAKDDFMLRERADAWVISYAKNHKCTVVTSEVKDQRITVSIPIPNVCENFKIPFCNTFKLLRELNFKF